MKRIVLLLILTALLIPSTLTGADASLISDRSYRAEQRKEQNRAIKDIKALFAVHTKFANNHDIKGLNTLYSDNYINNDGFDKKTYFKSVEDTWESCKDLTYTLKVMSVNVTGEYATVNVEETATGTVYETMDFAAVAGEIHSKSTGIYHLEQINGKWFIAGETSLSDESSLLYGDARFMNIEIQAPAQVSSGETYTTTVRIDADDNTFILGSIDHDPVTYPANPPKSELKAVPQSRILERLIKANTQNLNEYTITSLAISKVKNEGSGNLKVYMSGLACIMKRVNIIPKNEFIKLED